MKSGFAGFAGDGILNIIMILLSFVLFYLAIVKQYEPLLMLPIAFGMLLTNLPFAELYHPELWSFDPAVGNLYYAPQFVENGVVDGITQYCSDFPSGSQPRLRQGSPRGRTSRPALS
ncbi:MAG: sodium ion-translocating decarboxylase subunit beta, partial [Oscillospiraceae bacterium]|nr:sodium ion-translocating decarboxylase subunit beta [Oscillospiraceae bacterium]